MKTRIRYETCTHCLSIRDSRDMVEVYEGTWTCASWRECRDRQRDLKKSIYWL